MQRCNMKCYWEMQAMQAGRTVCADVIQAGKIPTPDSPTLLPRLATGVPGVGAH